MPAYLIVLIALAIIAGVAVIVYIAKLTLPKLKEYLKEREIKKERQKVAFGDTRKIINENAVEILKKAPKMTMQDLENICEETPYFVVDYNPDTEETADFTKIKTDEVGEDVESLMANKGGIVVFD